MKQAQAVRLANTFAKEADGEKTQHTFETKQADNTPDRWFVVCRDETGKPLSVWTAPNVSVSV